MSNEQVPSPTSARGREARSRILRAALRVFGRDGFDLATTRRIAHEADVSLPAIKYYFENKQGLYLACAREIVDRYQTEVGGELQAIVVDLDSGCSPDAARGHLKWVMRRVSAIAEGEGAGSRTAFVLRELNEQGPAFEVLYRELWQPGVRLTAALIARIEEKPVPDRESHLRALMLHASLTAFSTTRPVSLRYLDNVSIAPDDDGDALTIVDAHIDQLGATSRIRQAST
jgi:TetR/AcrR family transcriptional regulator, regulator of cefoperazone and chloramphenicol sensitivity